MGLAFKYANWLEEKIKRKRLMKEEGGHLFILKEDSNIRILLVKGSRRLVVMTDKDTYEFSLKLNTARPAQESSVEEIERSNQYRRLTAIGFKTINYKDYFYKTDTLLIELRMYYGVIDTISVNKKEVEMAMFNYLPQEQRLIIRKGLRRDERILYRNPMEERQ
jgi:hypothetical protein